MRRLPIPPDLAGRAILAAAAIAALAIIGYLAVQLARAEADLRDTRAAARDSTDALAEARAALAAAATDLANERAAGDALRRENAGLLRDIAGFEVDRAALLGYINDGLVQQAALTDELDATEAARLALGGELDTAETRIAGLYRRNTDIQGQLAEVTLLFATRNTEYTTLDADHRRLVNAVAAVNELEARVRELGAEITALEERRRPLLLAGRQERVEGFLCTGSMEPAITCLDTATWVTVFSPEEIVKGAVISFDNRACRPGATAGRTAHRVQDTYLEDGVLHYWPKGDAHAESDGCWVPSTAVHGYIIELHKNTVPENAVLRDNVNASNAAYREAREAYVDVIEQYCGHRQPERCSVSLEDPLGREAQRLLRISMDAYEHYRCWYNNAANSLRPGHIPHDC